ncbi:MAG: ERF family protein [Candidatus Dormibacteria bacterium]
MSATQNSRPDPFSPEEPAKVEPQVSKGFYTALAKAQSAFLPVRRDKTVIVRTKAGGTYSFSYAPLEAILKATLPALNAAGFALVQHVESDFLVTTLYHADGRLSGSIKILVGEGGPQAYGSALTYARRYGVTLLLGICADDDDDANAAEGNEVTETRSQYLTPERRESYLAPISTAIEEGDTKGLKLLVSELTEGEQRGVWSFLSTKQKQKARDLLQGRNSDTPPS